MFPSSGSPGTKVLIIFVIGLGSLQPLGGPCCGHRLRCFIEALFRIKKKRDSLRLVEVKTMNSNPLA